MTLRHAKLDGLPVRFAESGDGSIEAAWLFCAGRWHPACTAEVASQAGTMTAKAFVERFGYPPPLVVK